MVERPILFSAPMVRALVADTKTQTRRVVKPQPLYADLRTFVYVPGDPIIGIDNKTRLCPYGAVGGRLWVREAWRSGKLTDPFAPREMTPHPVWYDAVGTAPVACNGRPRPAMFMPRWASRITLEITGVRVERLQDISDADARAEGISELVPASKRLEGLTPAAMAFAAAAVVDEMPRSTRRGFLQGALAAALGFKASASRPWEVQPGRFERAPTAQQLYAVLWESINGPGSWAANPFCWVIKFRRASS